MALPPSWHQHCTDEAQKAETVLSAVIYIYIYIYICCIKNGTRKKAAFLCKNTVFLRKKMAFLYHIIVRKRYESFCALSSRQTLPKRGALCYCTNSNTFMYSVLY